MAHKITILAMPESSDSLKRDVNIVFTLTPTETYKPSPPHKPVAFAGMTFSSHSESSQTFSWERDVAFATYEAKDHNGRKKCVLGADHSPVVPTGHYTVVRTNALVWDELCETSMKSFSFALVGGDALAQSLSIVHYVTIGGVRAYLPLIAWPPTYCENLGSSSNLVLQAYVVKDAGLDGTILESSDLNHPLFPEPLAGEALRESPAWILTEDGRGEIHLRKVNMGDILKRYEPIRSLEQGVETLTKSFDVMRNQLDTLVKSLDDTHQRLAKVEESVSTNQTELHEVQRTLATTRDEMSRLHRQSPEVANLAASLDRTNDRVATVETSTTKLQGAVKGLSAARGDLERLGVSVQSIQQQVSAVNTSLGTIVDHRLPAVESKSHDLDESLGHVQDQLSAARTAAGTTRDRVDRLNRGVLSVQATVDTLGASVGQDQDRLSAMEESMGQIRQRLDAAEKHWAASDGAKLPQSPSTRGASSPARDNPTVTNESLTTIRRHLVVLNGRLPVMEARIDKVEKSVGAVELSLVTTGHELVSLGSRVALTEVGLKSLHPEEPWDESEPPSPGVFPSQTRLNTL